MTETMPATASSEVLPHVEAPVRGRHSGAPGRRRHSGVLVSVVQVLVGSALAFLGALPIARYLWIVAHRITFPFELEWMEGGSVEVVRRLVEGHNIYGPPSMAFTPWPYPPLYFWVSAAFAKVIGVGFLPLRLVSVVASLVVLWLLYKMVAGEGGDRIAGLLAAGLYASTFRLSGEWADIGRADSLFLALALGAVAVARRAESTGGGALVGLLFFLSFFTKQDGLLIAAPVLIWMVFARRRAGIAALAVLSGLLVVSTLVLDAFSHGWYQYYVFEELSSQGINHLNWVDFWRYDIFHPLAPLVLFTLGAVGLLFAGRRWWSLDWRTSGFWLSAAVGLLGAGWAGRLHLGGYNDVLMPAYAALALGVGLLVGLLRSHPEMLVRVVVSAAVVGLIWIQLDRIAYPLGRQIPTASDTRAGDRFLALLRRLPGEVIVFDHPYYSTLAGKGSFADGEAVDDIERSGPSLARRILVSDMHHALLGRDIGAVILDDPGDEQNLGAELRADYHLLPSPAVTGKAFFPVTDLPLRPSLVFVRDGSPR